MATTDPPAAPPNRPDGQTDANGEEAWRPFAATGQLARQIASIIFPQLREDPQPEKTLDRTTLIWLLGLLPAIFACLRLMILARGNTETLKSLMQNLNVTALVLATIIPLGSSLLTWWLFFSIIVRASPGRKPGRGLSLVLLALIVGFIDFYAMPLRYILVNLVCFVLLVLCMLGVVFLRQIRHPSAERINTGMAQVWGVLFVAAPLLFWLSSGVWLPKEKLTIGATSHEPVYVLSYDERWVKYMDESRVVQIAKTDPSTSRQMVGASKSFWYQTPYLWSQEWFKKHNFF
jgi:hypothetical protein